MYSIRTILVVITPKQPEQLALKRARMIPIVTRSQLHLRSCDRHQQ